MATMVHTLLFKYSCNLLGLAFVAGNPLKGKVVARVTKTIPPTAITLNFIGKEKTQVTYQSGSGQHGSSRRTKYGQRTFASGDLILRDEGHSDLHPGVYAFTFSLQLSESLPSSMNGAKDNDSQSNWRIQYKVSVTASNRQGTVQKQGERYLVIASSRLPNTRVPARIPPTSESIEGLLNKKQGMLSFGAYVKDAHVGRGLPLEIYLAARNHSTATIHRVECKLREKVTWTAQPHSETNKRTIALIHDVDVPGILRGKQSKSDVEEWKRSGIDLQDILRDLEQGANKITLPIPWGCRDSFRGSLIRIEHYLKITIFTKMLVKNPEVRIPLKVGFPPITSNSQQLESAPEPEISLQQPDEPEIEVDAEPINIGSRPPPFAPAGRPGIYPQHSMPRLPDTDAPPPMVAAVIVEDDNTIRAPLATAPMEVFALGGLPVYTDTQTSILPSAPPAPPSTPTLEALLEEMRYSISDYDIILRKLSDTQWMELLSGLTPDEFGSVLAHVNMDSDQPRVAETLAQCIGSQFTCAHCRAAAQNGADWNTSALVQSLLPYCVDIVTNHQVILSALSEWDQTVCRRDVDIAISRRQG
jgi:hypothetical protein